MQSIEDRNATSIAPRWQILAIAFVAVVCAGRLLYSLGMDIHPDEAYYWTWSRMLDWSFNDQGPGIAFYIALFTTPFGDTIFALKLGAAVAAFVAILLLFYTAVEMRLGVLRSFLALGIMTLLPGFFGGALMLLHDSALLLCWTAALYCTVRYVYRRELLCFYLIFVFLGLGVLTKYTMVFFALSIVLWFFLEKSVRPLVKSVHFWAAVLLGAVLSTPLLIWNMQNDWEGIQAIVHLRSAEAAPGQPTEALFLLGQALSFSPLWLLLFVAVAVVTIGRYLFGQYHRLRGDGFRLGPVLERFNPLEYLRAPVEADEVAREYLRGRAAQRFVLIQSLILPGYFLLMSTEIMVQPNWVFPSYPAMALVIAANRIEFPVLWMRRAYDSLYALGLVFVIVFDLFILFSVSLTAYMPGNVQPFWIPGNRVRGFREAIAVVEADRRKTDPTAAVATNRYQDAALASWYMDGQPFVTSMNILQKNQYSFWPGLERGKNYYIFAIQENTCEKAALFWGPILKYMFEEVHPMPERDIVLDGVIVKRVNAFHAKNFQNNWDGQLAEYLNERVVLDFMPNLKGKYTGVTSKKGQKTISREIGKVYFSKRGKTVDECSVY